MPNQAEPINPITKDRIVAAYLAGAEVESLKLRFGLSKDRIQGVIKAAGHSIRPREAKDQRIHRNQMPY